MSKKLGDVPGTAVGDFAPIVGAEVLTGEQFMITGARESETQFGTRIVFEVVWEGEEYSLFLSPNKQRLAVLHYFESAPDVEPIGPLTIEERESTQTGQNWFVLVDVDAAQDSAAV